MLHIDFSRVCPKCGAYGDEHKCSNGHYLREDEWVAFEDLPLELQEKLNAEEDRKFAELDDQCRAEASMEEEPLVSDEEWEAVEAAMEADNPIENPDGSGDILG